MVNQGPEGDRHFECRHDGHERWTMCAERRPDAEFRVYFFPHAGGTPAEYAALSAHVGSDVEVHAVVLPARAARFREPPYRDMASLVDDLVAQLRPIGPYALFGHSLGALIAYEYTRAVRARSLPAPCRLFVSGHVGPAAYRPVLPTRHLDDEAFLHWFAERLFPMAPELYDDPELRSLVLPYVRADLDVQRSYRPPAADDRIETPIVAFVPLEDRISAGMRTWEQETDGSFWWVEVPDGHFYLRSHGAIAMREVEAHLCSAPRDR